MNSPNYNVILQEATKKRCIAELRIQATIPFYQASAMEEDGPKLEQYRAEIHALQDIVLDCISTQMFCITRINN